MHEIDPESIVNIPPLNKYWFIYYAAASVVQWT